jgi:putative transposase
VGVHHSSRAEVFVHVVWSTWDRLPLLGTGVREQVFAAIQAECGRMGADVVAIGGVEDHVHLLVRLPATVALATLVKQVKGSTSHLVNHAILPRAFKWQGGYAAFSVSRRAVPAVRDYVPRQEEHHRAGTIHPSAEPLNVHEQRPHRADPSRAVREGGLRASPAANSFAPAPAAEVGR